ncbi:MAG: thioredoxin domain-containing protein [Winogradskyella sp.]|nr:thioredoxin domain-containing protein [Winogradskyella sp.]RNC84251.1 MAG: thioredoxin domain-containing protein [Winogradskyella sp.]
MLSCNKKNEEVNTQLANDLINETSPYLLQHAYNPVDWKAWNNKSLELAKSQNKLIIVSIGYSACHWCHVMEEESFQNDSIAKLMNDNFVSIKVDREERPDVDKIYLNAVELMNGSGGWPLNCITLPDGRPVFGGTYFTKRQWAKILKDMSELYKNNPQRVVEYATNLTEGIKNSELITFNTTQEEFTTDFLSSNLDNWKTQLDTVYGGIDKEPKFPLPSHLNFLLRYSFQTENDALKQYVMNSLEKMANGGIYDQLDGGFSRYSVDKKWHIPHFEKMLYDNSQLVSLYAKAYQLTKNEYFKTVVTETLNFIDKELSNTKGAYFSSLDADSKTKEGEKEEGAFYVWTKDELKQVLGEDFALFSSYYNINSIGRWEKDKYVLYKTNTDEEFCTSNTIEISNLKQKIVAWKSKLSDARNTRDKPNTDDKILTSWNALMLKAHTDAYKVFGDESYLEKAIANAEFIKENQLTSNGSLYRNYKNGKSSINGFLEDYTQVISAYISLYQVTLNEDWLNSSKQLTDYCLNNFFDQESGMFFFNAKSENNLITNKIETIDNAIPSSNSVMADNLYKLSHYYSEENYANIAKQMLNNMVANIKKSPSSFSNWLNLYLNFSNPYYEVAISGKDAHAKLNEFNAYYLPNILVTGSTKESSIPILKNRYNEDDTYIYVCVNGTCRLPVNSVERAIVQLLK